MIKIVITSFILWPMASFGALPKGIPKTSKSSAACFLPGEKESIESSVARKSISSCDKPKIKPVSKIEAADEVYTDSSYSTYDCAKVRESFKLRLPTSLGLVEMLDDASEVMKDPYNPTTKAQCLLNNLHAWAEANGYSSGSDLQETHIRSWNVGSIAMMYLKIPVLTTLAKQQGKEDKILDWFQKRGDQILINANSMTHRNNHYYWRGFSLVAIGIVVKDLDMIKKSKSIFDFAINEIQTSSSDVKNKGWLAAELARGSKAQHYHMFSLKPIMGMVGLSKAVNCNFLESAQENKLEALIRKLAEAGQDPSVFKKKTGVEQDEEIAGPESLFTLLGDDAQAMRMIKGVENYLDSQRGFHLKPNKNGSAPGQMGGNVIYTPEPASVATNQKIRDYCKSQPN